MKSLVEQFAQVFEQDGLGRIEDRKAVLSAFLAAEQHVTAHEVTDRVGDEGVSLDEGYVRVVLDLFCRYGLAVRREFQGRDPVYEHLHLGQHHDHLICVRCGKIEEFSDGEVEVRQRLAAHRHGFRSLRHRMEIYGLCSRCAVPTQQAFPLEMASAGEHAVVAEIGGGAELQRRLLGMGVRQGQEIVVLNAGRPGPFLIAVQDTRVALGHGMARRIMVVPKEEV